MRWSIALSVVLALAGCIGAPRASLDIARYDFGPPAKPASSAMQLPMYLPMYLQLRDVEVVAPSWLDTPQLQYRLLFADATRRRSYAESRWVAPPGELLEAALRRHLVGNGDAAANSGCILRVDVDELIQLFQTPQRSEGLIEVQVALVAPRGDSVLARNKFTVTKPAPTADASGGVSAVSAAAMAIAQHLQDWLAGLDRKGAAGSNIAKICNGA